MNVLYLRCSTIDVRVGGISAVLELAKTNPKCHIEFKPDFTSKIPLCYSFDDVIDKCNVTGTWAKYDQYLDDTCQDIEMLYLTGDPKNGIPITR